jgi:ATP-dependent helicase HrpA
LPVIEGRLIHYGAINPEAAREIFIRQALAEERLGSVLPFFRENVALDRSLAELAHKARQPLLAGPEAICRFYDERLPSGIHNDRALALFWRGKEAEKPGFLLLDRGYLLKTPPNGITADRFPPEIELAGRRYPLAYRFRPGHPDDGTTVTVPLADIPNLPAWRLEWLVPGLLGSKVAELLRGLPKSLRREINPVPEAAERLLASLGDPVRSLPEMLEEAVSRAFGLRIPPETWNRIAVPPFLRMNIRAVDGDGKTIAEGRDLAELAARLGNKARLAFEVMEKDAFEKTGLREWDFGDLPEKVEIRGGGGAVAFPALVDEGETAGIRLFHSREEAEQVMPAGFRRLVVLALGTGDEKLRRVVGAGFSAESTVLARQLGGKDWSLADAAVNSALDEAFATDQPPRSHRRFLERMTDGGGRLKDVAMEMRSILDSAFSLAAGILSGLENPPTPAHADSFRDIARQVESLLSPETLRLASAGQLRRLPRFLRAARLRTVRMGYALGKDRLRLAELLPYRERYETAATLPQPPAGARSLLAYRWLLEEWRVALFAQEPGEKTRSDAKRLETAWREYLALAELPRPIRLPPPGKGIPFRYRRPIPGETAFGI